VFPRAKITGVQNGRIKTDIAGASPVSAYASKRQYSEQSQVTASLGSNISTGSANSLSMNTFWNSQYQYFFTGLIPAEPMYNQMAQLALFYRDIYLNDNIGGTVVDLQSSFPFSDFDLRGVDEKSTTIFQDAMDQLNIQRMLPTVSTAYLTDGFFAGSLIFDPKTRRFIDTLVHDALQCSVIPGPFFNMMPQVNVQTSAQTVNLLGSDSPYAREYVASLPREFVNLMSQGQYTLSPISTLFVARKTLTDRAYVSYLHRLLPMYLIEKTMFRGTLVEASRRQRATSHITAGDDVWTPTGEELAALVSQFQQAEFDPLGGWVSTRNAVQITDIRPGGDFWKWTDMGDQLIPYKLRALGVSESFLSGETSYAAMESAYSLFLESQNVYRNHMTNSIFYSTLFPLIAVSNGLYKPGTADSAKLKNNQISKFLMHSNNKANLLIPKIMWHKSLEAKGEESTFDMLEQVSEKGVPIPLKQWMAAASLDKDTLLKDLKEDQELRILLNKYTGKDTRHESEEEAGDEGDEEVSARRILSAIIGNPTAQSLRKGVTGKRSILGRDWGDPQDWTVGKTGKKVYQHDSRMKTRDVNARIAKIGARMQTDAHYRLQMARKNKSQFGQSNLGEP
jgi:hypothetical protein